MFSQGDLTQLRTASSLQKDEFAERIGVRVCDSREIALGQGD